MPQPGRPRIALGMPLPHADQPPRPSVTRSCFRRETETRVTQSRTALLQLARRCRRSRWYGHGPDEERLRCHHIAVDLQLPPVSLARGERQGADIDHERGVYLRTV